MAKIKKSFWVALIEHCQEYEDPVRLWNGYIGWKLSEHFREEEPQFGWPALASNEMDLLNKIAANCGGYQSWSNQPIMDFSGSTFDSDIDFSDLILVKALFSESRFKSDVKFHRTRFFKQSLFRKVEFYGCVDFSDTIFEADVKFDQSHFSDYVFFKNIQFKGGATFFQSNFGARVRFEDSKFSEIFAPRSPRPIHLASFKGAQFKGKVSFRKVTFGENPYQLVESEPSIIVADFSDASFEAPAKFRHAVFKGAPFFFNCTLHEDTDFSRVEWPKATPTVLLQIDDAIRAWERLELMMSKLEKPLDRQIFYRLKMRTRRLTDGRFLRMLNWLFAFTCDYGWSVFRATMCWILHWCGFAVVLFLNAGQAAFGNGVLKALKLFSAALGTAFANAHAFLGLTGDGGYLASCRLLLIEESSHLWILAAVGAVQAVLGPVFLFLLLLTLRNRFRLA